MINWLALWCKITGWRYPGTLPRNTIYYVLHCNTCDTTYPTLVATVSGEMLAPDFEQCRKTAPDETGRLWEYHTQHAGHELIELRRES
jgi:hypothetical protein